MNEMINIPSWVAIAVTLLLVTGGTIILIGALGLMRLPSFYQRIHGPALTNTLGAGCLLLASIIYSAVLHSRIGLHELIIAAFILMTAPVVAMLLMRAAIYRDIRAGKPQPGMDPRLSKKRGYSAPDD